MEARGVHAEVWASIPWCVAGAASVDELDRARHHLERCAECRDEWTHQELVRDAMRLQGAPVPDVERGLGQVLARIDSEPLEQVGPATGGVRRAPWLWVRLLAVASVVQAVALALLATLWWQRADEPGYATLSQAEVRPFTPGQGGTSTVRLVLRPETSLAELQGLLVQSGLQVVSVGNDPRIIGVAARPGSDAPDAATLRRLRANPRVLLVEGPVEGR